MKEDTGVELKLVDENTETEEERIKREQAEFDEEIKGYKKNTTIYGGEIGDSFYDGDLPDEELVKLKSFQMSGPVQANQINFGINKVDLPVTDDVLNKANPQFQPRNRFEYHAELDDSIKNISLTKTVLKLTLIPILFLGALVILNFFIPFGWDNFFNLANKVFIVLMIIWLIIRLLVTMTEAQKTK